MIESLRSKSKFNLESIAHNSFLDKAFLSSKSFFIGCALCLMGLALLSVYGSYIFWWFQSVRGPSTIYFKIAFVVALFSGRLATMLLIFCLPLLPTLHSQLELILHPPVKYFISYPGIDVIVGFCTGLYLRHLYKTRSWRIKHVEVPWPFGLLLFVLALSTALAIARNLWQSALVFKFDYFAYSVLRFKVMEKANDFAPIADLIVYAIAALLTLVVFNILRNEKNKEEFLFKPVIFSIILSACWGIFQSQTAFGLSELTREYRPEIFGFGAEGFQPDIHAFAGHMLIGAVGLLGYVFYIAAGRMRYLATFACLLSWIAIVLSKSRASLVFAVLLTILFGLYFLKSRSNRSVKSLIAPILLLCCVTAGAFIVSYYLWLGELFEALRRSDISNFEKLNLLSRWRLELHRAALLMFDAFPWMGVGQGNFYRLSTILELTQSNWLANSIGDNAHNYFLQTLAETGLIGLTAFFIVFAWPYFHTDNTKRLVPATLLILSMFLGNIYSHSLLIRDNLFLLATFVALLYTYTNTSVQSAVSTQRTYSRRKVYGSYAIILVLMASIFFVVTEVMSSFYKMPFEYAGHYYQGAKETKNAMCSREVMLSQ